MYTLRRIKNISMKEDIILDEPKICNEYLDEKIGINGLAAKYHVGKLKIKDILSRNNIEIKKKGGQSQESLFKITDYTLKKYPEIEGKHYILTDRNSGFTTTDIENKAGTLTNYIRITYNVNPPSLYFRRKYYQETGNYWWEQWFNVTLVDNKPVKKCPYCDWETIDVTNKSGVFEQHLLRIHNITKADYLKRYPEEYCYFETVNMVNNRQMETDNNKFVICQECGKKLARIDSHHLIKHNMTKVDYIKKHGDSKLTSIDYHQRQSKASIITNMSMPFTKYSKAEIEIKEFIERYGFHCASNRTLLNGKEIDIFIPDKNLGIEYNGNKWHTEWFGKKDRYYHLNKMKECKNKGVNLISIFEDEYEYHKDIVLNKIIHLLDIKGLTVSKIYARKCEIKEINSNEAKVFLEKFHIQGYCRSTVFIGAFYDNKLIAVMSFLRYPGLSWELNRFASDYNYICCGVGGKLFRYFIVHYNYTEIKSFADRRWTINENDNLYTKLGFKFSGFTSPNYTYFNSSVDRYKRFHKFNFRKGVLLRRYSALNESMTETEMVKKLGYDRIWDCGLIKYTYVKQVKNNRSNG